MDDSSTIVHTFCDGVWVDELFGGIFRRWIDSNEGPGVVDLHSAGRLRSVRVLSISGLFQVHNTAPLHRQTILQIFRQRVTRTSRFQLKVIPIGSDRIEVVCRQNLFPRSGCEQPIVGDVCQALSGVRVCCVAVGKM